MLNFQSYSKYYDLLYKDKNYKEESDYITKLINNYTPDAKSILELGCGSGSHAYYFSQNNFEIFGVERSIEMVDKALEKNIKNFYPIHADIENFVINDKKFDVALSLFHVISYLTDNELLLKSLQNINQHLTENGIFIFDVWYTPAVYHQKPETRVKRLVDSEIEITRIAESEIESNRNVVNVNYEILIRDKKNNQTQVVKEIHPMRHFSIPEMQLLAKLSNFELLHAEEFLTHKKPTENSWGVCFILRKI
jgi:SAM-dependent methyltransferase